jgi:hypothetical protein
VNRKNSTVIAANNKIKHWFCLPVFHVPAFAGIAVLRWSGP